MEFLCRIGYSSVDLKEGGEGVVQFYFSFTMKAKQIFLIRKLLHFRENHTLNARFTPKMCDFHNNSFFLGGDEGECKFKAKSLTSTTIFLL